MAVDADLEEIPVPGARKIPSPDSQGPQMVKMRRIEIIQGVQPEAGLRDGVLGIIVRHGSTDRRIDVQPVGLSGLAPEGGDGAVGPRLAGVFREGEDLLPAGDGHAGPGQPGRLRCRAEEIRRQREPYHLMAILVRDHAVHGQARLGMQARVDLDRLGAGGDGKDAHQQAGRKSSHQNRTL